MARVLVFPSPAGGPTDGVREMKSRALARLSVLACLALAACGSGPQTVEKRAAPEFGTSLWGQRAEGGRWTASVMQALDRQGAPLVASVPSDIDVYCPGYRTADEEARKAFWVTFLSALAKHESTWRPEVSGGGGAWHGLLQISPRTAKGYGCEAQSAAELKDGGQNLSCGVRIMASTVTRDGVISAGRGGAAADWGPFRQADKLADIQARTRSAAVCRG